MTLAPSPKSDPPARAVCLVLALMTLAAYLPVFFHDYVTFDDPAYVSANPIVQQGLTWAGVKWAFGGFHASNWHPLTWISHMLDCQLFGASPGPQHLVNTIFHVANTVLLFVLWWRMTRAIWPSALVAGLFALHPLHVESVAWIAERKDVLSALFGLLAMLFYARYVEEGNEKSERGDRRVGKKTGVRFYLLALVFFALGLMAKPMLVSLPFVLLLLDGWPLGRFREKGFPRLLLEKALFFALAAASCVITVLAQRNEAMASLQQYPWSFRVSNAVVSYARYLGKTVWPTNLGIFYPAPSHYSWWQVVGAAAPLAGISVWVWLSRRREPCALVGWCWFLGMLAPVIGLVQVGNQAMADRYTYLPLVGIFVAVAFSLGEAVYRGRHGRVLVSLVLGVCLVLTERQLHFWRDSEVLFTHELTVTDQNGLAHMMLGAVAERRGEIQAAVKEYEAALRLDSSLIMQTEDLQKRPLQVQYQLLLGQTAELAGQTEEAIAHYEEALRLDPAIVEGHNNLGNLFQRAGKSADALGHYREAVQLSPGSALARCNLGTALVEVGRFDEGLREYAEAARLQPDDSRPHYLTGKAWLRRGQSAEAVRHFREALRLDPNEIQTLIWLARVLASDDDARVRNGKEALELAKRADELSGGKQPLVLDVLGMASAEDGSFREAQGAAEKAIALATAASKTNLVADLERRRELYLAFRPFREKAGEPGN